MVITFSEYCGIGKGSGNSSEAARLNLNPAGVTGFLFLDFDACRGVLPCEYSEDHKIIYQKT